MAASKRKGAPSRKDIPKAILEQLHLGEIETANLVEWLAVDQKKLLSNVLQNLGRRPYLHTVLSELETLKKQTVTTISEAIGTSLVTQASRNNDEEFLEKIACHVSDVVRCWAAYGMGKYTAGTMDEKLSTISRFAKDDHFGVREISWLAVRKDIAENLNESMEILSVWACDEDKFIRRFASEATRPRGVWCAHIPELKQNPELGLPILEPLRSDKEKYVQDSVGNWLNDASKTQPSFVKAICMRWESENDSKETRYIIKKALRTLKKKRI